MAAATDSVTSLAYDDEGAGTPVVFLHGLTFDRRTWRPIIERLEQPLAVAAAKRAINEAYDTTLTQGLAEERQAFFDLFATADQKEGMAAFVEKRPPRWTGR